MNTNTAVYVITYAYAAQTEWMETTVHCDVYELKQYIETLTPEIIRGIVVVNKIARIA